MHDTSQCLGELEALISELTGVCMAVQCKRLFSDDDDCEFLLVHESSTILRILGVGSTQHAAVRYAGCR
jgi:hypothetical protein